MSEAAVNAFIQEMITYHFPRYDELPSIPLYSDQVIEALNDYTAPFRQISAEHTITPAMINNYVKQHLIPPPVKKRYDREQLARLFCICLLKHVFSISEIRGLLEIQTRTYPFPKAYDYFCAELETALKATFSSRDFSSPSHASTVTAESELVRGSALCFAHKVFSVKFLEFYAAMQAE